MNRASDPTPEPTSPAAIPTAPGPGARGDTALDRIVLAPSLILSAFLVILDGASSWRLPLREVIPWLHLPALAAVGIWLLAALRAPLQRGRFALLVILALLAIYFPLAGLFGTWLPDPLHGISTGYDDWCYQSLGDYLLNHARGQVAGMSMLDVYGANLREARFSTAGALELIGSGVPFKDPPMSHFALGVLCLAVHFSSMLYLGRVLLGSFTGAAFAAFLATAAGWMSNALELANYDNLLFLALVPAWVGVLARLEARPGFPVALSLAGGLLLAALLDTFPEGLPLVGVLLVPLVVFLGWRCVGRPRLLWAGLTLLGSGLLLAAPYLPVFWPFFINQIRWAEATVLRGAGGPFPGLIDARRLPAFFALGEEWAGPAFTAWRDVLPAVLLALLAVGAWSWRRTHRWLPWVAVPLAALLLWQNGWKKYDYGTFKVLFCAGWWIYPAVVAGCIELVRVARLPAWSPGWLLVVLSVAIGWEKAEHRTDRGRLPTGFMGPLRELTNLRFVTQAQPLLLDFNGFDCLWSMYYLRHQPIMTFRQDGAMAAESLTPFLAPAAAPPPPATRFVLVRGKRPDALWSNDVFSLLLPKAYIIDLEGPYEVENGPGVPDSIWIGTGPETFRIRSAVEGDFELRLAELGIGPRASHPDHLSFEITDAAGTSRYEWQPGGPKKFPLHLRAGINLVTVRCAEPPAPVLPGGDAREVMLGIRGYSVGPRE